MDTVSVPLTTRYQDKYLVNVLIGRSRAPPTSNAEAQRLAWFLDQLERYLSNESSNMTTKSTRQLLSYLP